MDKRKLIKKVKRTGFCRVGVCEICGKSADWIYWRNVLIDFRFLTVEMLFYCDEHKPLEV